MLDGLQVAVEPYKQFARPYYSARDIAHGFDHIEMMIGRLESLSEGLPAPRPDRLCFLVCFHGLWPKLRDDAGFRDETRLFLAGLGWTNADIDDGLTGLERHLSSPETVEEQIVHDANYIELLGALGIAKAFTVGGVRGQTYEETIGIYSGRYLDQVEFLTPAGKVLAEEGRAYARAFLERLRNELRPSSGACSTQG